MKNSEKFLTCFNKIEQYLKKKYNKLDHIPFSSIVSEVKKNNSVVAKYEFDLRKYAKLRNVIVHGTVGEYVIAEPNNYAVKQIEIIERHITDPPKIYPLFKCSVRNFLISESILVVVKFMSQESFSQVPVYDGLIFKGLLTENAITKWLGSCFDDDIFNLRESTVESVLKYEENKNNYQFLKKTDSLFDALQAFEPTESRIRLEAILISENGKETEPILGIITIWDLPKINNLLLI